MRVRLKRGGANHHIVFTNVKDLSVYKGCEHNIITIFVGFNNWSSVVQQIYFYPKLIISGVDSSKRYCINQLQANPIHSPYIFNRRLPTRIIGKGIVNNLPKEIINPKIDLNKINTLLDKPKHNSHIKALRCFDELYPGFIYQHSEFEKLANESSNSKLNLTGVDYIDETRYDKLIWKLNKILLI